MRFQETPSYRYHQSTKHTVAKLYNSQWYLDWDNQPEPFRRYEGCPEIALPKPNRPQPLDYFQPEYPKTAPWTLMRLSQFLYYSMAISAWKEVPAQGARWSLRVNPSSGNLHPTETHLIAKGFEDLEDGVYHFRVNDFVLEQRAKGDVSHLLQSLHRNSEIPASTLTILLTSIFWREAWKYRDRAFRYCHHDLGHAVSSIFEALRGLGYNPTYRHIFDDLKIAALFGLSNTDENPGILIATESGKDGQIPLTAVDSSQPSLQFIGTPNALSPETIHYQSIADVYEATRGMASSLSIETNSNPGPLRTGTTLPLDHNLRATDDLWTLIRRRRSGVDFDGKTGITVQELGAILYRATESPHGDIAGFHHGSGGEFLIHLFLYLHRVKGVESGVYYYDRDKHALVLQAEGDARSTAASLSLGQNIASHSAFALSMIADLNRAYIRFGQRGYRAAHIESGIIGQGLYLGAEAVGIQGTGIGAFFDDDVNRFLDLPTGYEVIYHFTVGGAVEDSRIRVCKSYAFEDEPA